MSYLETIKYDENTNNFLNEKTEHYTYNGEEVGIITVFKDSDIAMVEDKDGNIFEISINELK